MGEEAEEEDETLMPRDTSQTKILDRHGLWILRESGSESSRASMMAVIATTAASLCIVAIPSTLHVIALGRRPCRSMS